MALWLQKGDNNTSFSIKWQMHTADSNSNNLVINGETVTEEGTIINEILPYYSTLYGEQGGPRPSWFHANVCFQ